MSVQCCNNIVCVKEKSAYIECPLLSRESRVTVHTAAGTMPYVIEYFVCVCVCACKFLCSRYTK